LQVAKELSKDVLNRLARLGAQARLDELEAERRAILKAFPGLAGGRKAPATHAEPVAAAKPARKARKKRNVSAAARKAASERMKQYWAAKKQPQA
jgi:hypothetical protein